ncbi:MULTISPECIES: GNAT family N-acetyltransferase [Brachybacterium]|uniref:GNAT family N-acetyltransferase n=1 Tax=Brachybacterium TaxID=43668 RepID=UPI0006B5C657|nr:MULTISPECIES: GNAT family N-acetyltransferase [Brachybacterium]MCZ4328078.1 GNAT family N-acetyltransferase [Brachybacterium paraconglomeratum]GAP79340.1 GCN5-related N-acetyltransferase [Brachybacterium sp. SW0106-09]
MQILDATAQHADGIAAIYNHAVEHTTAIWNERLVDAEDRAAWLAARQSDGFPVLVALEEDGTVLGYATYGPWRPHDGYRRTVEHSVYVREGLRGRGTGSTLLSALIERARAQGLHVMVAGIDAENLGSVRLHERFGFTRVGVLPEVGIKFGRWLDLAFLQLVLDQDAPDRRSTSAAS